MDFITHTERAQHTQQNKFVQCYTKLNTPHCLSGAKFKSIITHFFYGLNQ